VRDYELVHAIEAVIAMDGEEATDGECIDEISKLLIEYKAYNFTAKGNPYDHA
jgi:hypothetical protein